MDGFLSRHRAIAVLCFSPCVKLYHEFVSDFVSATQNDLPPKLFHSLTAGQL